MSPQALISAPQMRQSASDISDTASPTDLDPRVLMATLGGNLVDHQLMLLMFGLALSTSLREMNSAVCNQDWFEASEVAQDLKSSALAIGALRRAMATEQFEDATLGNRTATQVAFH
jgi:HPt (histidine-containing phosphotransfer) domain-containing protein